MEDEFIRDVFTETLLFTIFRDKPTLSSQHNRDLLRLRFPKLDVSKIYRKTINYQIKTFGHSLNSNKKKGLVA